MRLRKNRAALAAMLLLLAACAAPALAAETAGAAGRWEGEIEIPGTRLGIAVDLTADGGAWKGDISIPLQNAKDLPLANVKVDGAAVEFEIQGVPGTPTFKGTLSADGARIAGEFTQGGGTFPFELRRAAAAGEAAQDALAGYDEFVAKMIEDWRVPGLAVAIVKGGEVVYAKGFGHRDAEKRLPVTADTLFAIGSATKAFTTFTMATLVDEGKLDWDQPVRSFLPGFRLHDVEATEMITPRDLVTHRSGLPRHDLLWYNNNSLSRKELVDRLRYLEPNQQLRAKWQYNNLMFLTAGYLVEHLTGKSWEDNVRERVFTPLGMSRSNFSVLDSQQDADHALPYKEDDDRKLVRMPFRNITTVGPAGSINSSANEMAKWVRLHLGNGKAGDRQVIGAATLADLHAPHMLMGAPAERPEFSPPAYGLGWIVDSYRGHSRVEHGGAIDGFSALVTLLPQDDLGMVILTNKNAAGVPERLARHTIDRFLKLDPIDWNGEALARREKGEAAVKEAKARKESVRRPGTRPAHKLEEYAGDYEHPGYGPLKVTLAGNRLELTYNGITAPLEHWHFEVFSGKEGAEDPTFENARFLFQGDVDGNVAAVAAQFEPQVKDIVFTKKPDARLFDPTFIARYAGNYDLAGQTVTIAVAGSGLTLSLPGQPTYHLVPGLGGVFTLKEYSVFTFRFVEDDKGDVTGADVRQPGSVLLAKRMK